MLLNITDLYFAPKVLHVVSVNLFLPSFILFYSVVVGMSGNRKSVEVMTTGYKVEVEAETIPSTHIQGARLHTITAAYVISH